MEIIEMTKEQLIAQIDVLNEQVKELKAGAAQNKKNEPVLQESDESFRLFFDIAPIGLGISNSQGKLINANKVAQDLLGYSLEEFKTMNIFDIYDDPRDRQRLLDILNKSNHVRDFETKIKHKDGETWTVLMNSDYIELDNQKVLLTSIHDITRFKKSQEDLRESAERYHLLFSNAPVGITVTDFRGGIPTSNQAIQELLGYTPEEFKKITAVDFYVDPTERYKLIDLSKKSGIVRDFEARFKRKDGKIISVLINSDVIDYKDQHEVLLTSIRDITNLKHAEAELTKERDFTNAILDTAASLVLVLDQQGIIKRFNSACEKVTGYTPEDMKNQHIWDILSADSEMIRKEIEKLLGGHYPSTYESFWLAKSGEHRLISWVNTVLLDNEGHVEYIIATGIDITERRQAEMGLQEANKKLVTWVSELEERSAEMNQLSEMGEQLQSCQNIEEACAISVQYLQKICPDSQGALYLISPSKDFAEAVEMWGNSISTEKTFTPIDCWAIRRGRPHLVDKEHPGLLCGHIIGTQVDQHLCVPMMAHGEAMGILHLNHTAPENNQRNSTEILCNDSKTQLITTVAEHIALALSNLKLRETLRQQSIRDILTGLFNRRYMEESLTRELQRAVREKKPIGVIMLDIDHFKDFNDNFGHDGGDALLRELGRFLMSNTRGGDIISRYGGEEFVAVLPGATLEETRLRAEELRQGVKKLMVYHLGKLLGECMISLGVSAFPEHGLTRDELLKSADDALYRAKNEGRDKVVVALVIS